jgi:protein AbiQ
MGNSSTLIKIEDGKLGVINVNNMIPVNDSDIKSYNPTDEKQKILVNKQLRWFNKVENRDRIPKIAEELHSLYISRKLPKRMAENCNNFKLLNKKCKEWENK